MADTTISNKEGFLFSILIVLGFGVKNNYWLQYKHLQEQKRRVGEKIVGRLK
jgi:hypothetical protein